MKNLAPHFILENYQNGIHQGELATAGLFIDISGFTQLTETLMQHGTVGSERLAEILGDVFAPLVRSVYDKGGFITKFAGDAFTALFPRLDGCNRALAAGWDIHQEFENNPIKKTSFGEFTFAVKVGVSVGKSQWGIFDIPDAQRAYYFKGSAIDGCALAEHHAEKGDVVISREFYDQVKDQVIAEPIDDADDSIQFVRVTSVTGDLSRYQVAVDDSPFDPPVFPDELVARFTAPEILDLKSPGEFRNLSTVFISLRAVPDHDQLEDFVNILMDLKRQYGGYLTGIDFGDKGCNFMMLWGAPISFENNVPRALNFALDLRKQSNEKLRIGITQRLMFSGFAGTDLRGEYTGYGRGVNLAARFMMAANWDEIWIDEETHALAESLFEAHYFDKMRFKGFADPLSIYRLSRRREFTEIVRFSGEMVGRQIELDCMKVFIDPLFHSQFAGLIYVYGEAGMGKSRLIYEVKKNIEEKSQKTPRIKWFHCPCEEIIRQSLNPFKYALRRYFNQSSGRSFETNKADFEKILTTLSDSLKLVDSEQADELLVNLIRIRSFLGAMIDLHWEDSLYEQLDPESRFENSMMAFKSLIKAESLIQPVVVEIEDGHWIDSDSQRMLSVLIRNLEHEPIVIIAACRYQDDGSLFQFDLEREIRQETIDLNYLAWQGVKDFTRQILGDEPSPELVDLLMERTQGNPFFVEQMAHYFKERDLLEPRCNIQGKPIGLKPETAGAPIPTTINATLIARLDRLTTEVKQVIQTAAVLGREFEVKIVSGILISDLKRGPRLEKTDDLSQKVRKIEEENVWSPLNEIRYIFHHALLRDVAYNMQLQARLRELHRMAGDAFEAMHHLDLAPYYGDIAYHYEKSETEDKALIYLIKAGNKAKDEFANDHGLDYYRRAYKLCKKYEDQAYILESLGDILQLTAKYQKAIENYERVRQLAHEHSDRARIALADTHLASIQNYIGKFDRSIELQLGALEVYRELNDQRGIALALHGIGTSCMYQQKFDQAYSYLEQALAIRREIGEKNSQARTLMNIGALHYYKGDLNISLDYYHRAKNIFVQTNDLKMQTKLASNLGALYKALSDTLSGQKKEEATKNALVNYKEAERIAEKIGDLQNLTIVLNNLGGFSWNTLDNLPMSYDYFYKSMQISREIYDRVGLAISLGSLGEVSLSMNRYDQGVLFCQEAVQITEETDDALRNADILITLGKLFRKKERFSDAIASFESASRLADSIENESLRLKSDHELEDLYGSADCSDCA
ncbi:MAG: hypothetical protein B6244_11025 [Candidatus Cloacimonetes bacterium 4572_55]|nr:MAG: hypothetical protein B6244_11025 [Candidatus Cloacimonetes bacterium 4572_55]